MTHTSARDVIAFGERLLALLDQGSFVATYKYAVLLGLMDLCIEKTDRKGAAPDSVTTYQLAERVTELYWPQTSEFRGRTLKQNSGQQARIVTDIMNFRASLDDPSVPMDRARREAPEHFERLLRQVEWTLVLMPLPRLQVMGRHSEPLIYQIGWDTSVSGEKQCFREYAAGRKADFDNQIRLLPSVGDHLAVLNGLLRPLIHRAWSSMVAQLNQLDESKLERFLFRADRIDLSAVRPALADMQDDRCFYCESKLRHSHDVDHFVPWARYPDNGIENLVVSDKRCNQSKRDFLAATDHVRKWRRRNESCASDLGALTKKIGWECHREETLGMARGIYLRLRAGARLWVCGQEFQPLDPVALSEILG